MTFTFFVCIFACLAVLLPVVLVRRVSQRNLARVTAFLLGIHCTTVTIGTLPIDLAYVNRALLWIACVLLLAASSSALLTAAWRFLRSEPPRIYLATISSLTAVVWLPLLFTGEIRERVGLAVNQIVILTTGRLLEDWFR